MKRPVALGLVTVLAGTALLGVTRMAEWIGSGRLQPAETSRLAGPAGAGGRPLQGLIYLAVGIPAEETLDSELRLRTETMLQGFGRSFRDLHPGVQLQLLTFPEPELVEQIHRRQQAGLAPDLLLVNAGTAIELENRGLARSIQPSPAIRDQIEPDVLARVRLPDGKLAGLPLLQQPELACFNRTRLPQGSPADLDQLLRLSAGGVRVGLSVEPLRLVWTVGGLGAGEALLRANRGLALSSEQRQRLSRWLGWLQNASFQQQISFHANQEELLTELKEGRLDWISCRSSSLSRLRSVLKAALGVAPLPGGPDGAATPINRERVLALGMNSSANQRRIAMELARFSINPLVQRKLTMHSLDVLPVNRFVPAPVASSSVLESMVRSAEAAEQANPLVLELMDNRAALPALATILSRVIFSEIDPSSGTKELIEALRPETR